MPGDSYSITVSAQAAEAGSLSLSDDIRPLAVVDFVTDASGVFVYRDIAPKREVTLTVRILMNQSGSWMAAIKVVATACTAANAQDCLGFLRADLLVATAQLGFFVAVLILVLNVPSIAAAMLRYQKDASLRGSATLKELAKSPLSRAWTVLSPTRQISDTMPTERVAVELKRREAIAELVSLARSARRFDYDRHLALVRGAKKVVSLYNLERNIIKRRDRENMET